MKRVIQLKIDKSKTILSVLLLILIVFSSNVLANDSDSILVVIKSNYQAAVDGNVDAYLSTMDTLFLDETSPEGFSFADYYKGTFEVIKTIDYNINNPQIEFMKDSALVFYNVQGTIKNKETGEEKKIDNDVVTFLWDYGNDWKIRWTIAQSMYQFKLEAGLLTNLVTDMTFSEMDNTSLMQEAIEKGIITKEDKDLKSKDSTGFIQEEKDSSGNKIPFLKIIFVILLGLFVYSYVKKPVVKTQVNKFAHKLISMLKYLFSWIKKNVIPYIISFSKWIFKMSKLGIKHSKKAYMNAKPHVKKAYEKGKKKIINKNITKK